MAVSYEAGRALLGLWDAIPQATTGDVLPTLGYGPLTVQISGTFGGGTVALEGSNDGVTWIGLNDAGGTVIAAAADSIILVQQMPSAVRPVVTGGDGTTAIDVSVAGAV